MPNDRNALLDSTLSDLVLASIRIIFAKRRIVYVCERLFTNNAIKFWDQKLVTAMQTTGLPLIGSRHLTFYEAECLDRVFWTNVFNLMYEKNLDTNT